MAELKRTPLHEFNVAHGARMVDFAGWEMPVQYKSIVEEHKATRTAAGLFDVSHMGEATVEGPGATAFLDYVLTNSISNMPEGRALYSLMCNHRGGVVDDLLVYRRGEDSYLLCLNAANTQKDIDWLAELSGEFEAEVSDVSDEYALLALQGPQALEILSQLANIDLDQLGYYWFAEGQVAGVDCLVSRTGYTGEKGVELFVPPQGAVALAEALLKLGSPQGLELAGLGARDSLRLEAGYSLYGHEIDDEIGPVQAGLMWTVKLKKKPDFIGRGAIERLRAEGPDQRIVFFKTGGRRIARAGAEVLSEGKRVGRVVSGAFSPMLNEAIGSALVASSCKGELAVDIRGKAMPIYRQKPPFVELNPQK